MIFLQDVKNRRLERSPSFDRSIFQQGAATLPNPWLLQSFSVMRPLDSWKWETDASTRNSSLDLIQLYCVVFSSAESWKFSFSCPPIIDRLPHLFRLVFDASVRSVFTPLLSSDLVAANDLLPANSILHLDAQDFDGCPCLILFE